MKSLFNKYAWLQLILSILLLFGGTLIIVFAATGKENFLADALNIIAAVILFLFGIFAILASFVFETKKVFTNGLLYGSASIAFGIFLLIKKMVLLDYLVLLLAIFFIVIGAVELTKAIVLTVYDRKKVFGIVVTYLVSVIFITGGILALVYQDKVDMAFCIVAGVLLVAAGIYEMVIGIITMVGQVKKRPPAFKKKKAKKKVVIDSETKEEVAEEEEEEEEKIKELDYTDKPAIEKK